MLAKLPWGVENIRLSSCVFTLYAFSQMVATQTISLISHSLRSWGLFFFFFIVNVPLSHCYCQSILNKSFSVPCSLHSSIVLYLYCSKSRPWIFIFCMLGSGAIVFIKHRFVYVPLGKYIAT